MLWTRDCNTEGVSFVGGGSEIQLKLGKVEADHVMPSNYIWALTPVKRVPSCDFGVSNVVYSWKWWNSEGRRRRGVRGAGEEENGGF